MLKAKQNCKKEGETSSADIRSTSQSNFDGESLLTEGDCIDSFFGKINEDEWEVSDLTCEDSGDEWIP